MFNALAVKAVFFVSCWEDVIERNAYLLMWKQKAKLEEDERQLAETKRAYESLEGSEVELNDPSLLPFPMDDHWTYLVGFEESTLEPAEDWNKKAHLLVSMNKELIHEFLEGYQSDPFFRTRYINEVANPHSVVTPSHF